MKFGFKAVTFFSAAIIALSAGTFFATAVDNAKTDVEPSAIVAETSDSYATLTFGENVIVSKYSSGDTVPIGTTIDINVYLDNYVNHKLLINGEEVQLTDYYRYGYLYNAKYTINSENVTIELVEDKWPEEKLSEFVGINADNGITVYYYNTLYSVVNDNYAIDNGKLVKKGQTICFDIIADSSVQYRSHIYVNNVLLSDFCFADSFYDNNDVVIAYKHRYTYIVPDDANELRISNKEDNEVVAIDEYAFPDKYFRSHVYYNFDTDKSGGLSQEELDKVTSIDVSGNSSYNRGITNLNGVEFFKNLTSLNVDYNQLTSLDLSKNTSLTALSCNNNQLTSLDLSKNTELSEISCNNNNLTSLDLSNNLKISTLAADNNIHSIGAVNDRYSLSNLQDFDASRASGWTGAEYNISSNELMNFISKTVTYTYNCGNGKNVSFTLKADSLANTDIIDVDAEHFPDTGFRQYVSEEIDLDSNDELSPEELDKVTSIDVSDNYSHSIDITNLNGIEYFKNLTSLNVENNQLTSLDVSKNTSLISLSCNNNQLTSLDLSKNTSLTALSCNNNQLTSLDVSKNTSLISLSCNNNQLTSLDISQNTELTELSCYNNKLTSLDLSNNQKISTFDANNNIYSIGAVIDRYSLSNLPGFDASRASGWTGAEYDISTNELKNFVYKTVTYTYNCGNGKNVSFTLKADSLTFNDIIAVDAEHFPDADFRKYVSEKIDLDSSGGLSERELDKVTSIDVSDDNPYNDGITNLKGIEYFKNLTSLDVGCNQLTSLDVSQNTALTYLDCGVNQLTSLDVSKNTALTYLGCSGNQLTSLDVSNNTALTYLGCTDNQLTSLDVSNNICLTQLYCILNQLTTLDVSHNTALTELYCNSNKLTNLDVSKNTALTHLECSYNKLTSIDLSKNTALTTLKCYGNQLTSLNVCNNLYLTSLECPSNQLTKLDVSRNTSLTKLLCNNNLLTNLDISKCTQLQTLHCHQNQLTSLDVSNNKYLRSKYNASISNNTYSIGKVIGLYPLSNLPGNFDSSRATEWQGAKFDENTNSLKKFTSDTVTYKYDCGNDIIETFTLKVSEYIELKGTLTFGDKIMVASTEQGYASGDRIEYDTEIWIGMDIEDYVNNKVLVNGEELELNSTGDGFWYNNYYIVNSDVDIQVVSEKWSEERMAKYVTLNADEDVTVWFYNSYCEQITALDRPIKNGGYIGKDNQVCIRIPLSVYPVKPNVYINGTLVDCSLNNEEMWQIWAYDIPDDADKLNIRVKSKSISLGEKIYAYYEDNTGNIVDLPNGSMIYPEYSAIYVHADIDDYVDHALYVNDRELALTQTGDGYHFYGTIENPFSYENLEVKLVEKAWTDTELAKYVRVYADKGINVYHYNSYCNEAKINYTVPTGGYFTKNEAIVIRVNSALFPHAGFLYINGLPVKCSLNSDNQWQIWAYEIPDDAEKLNISFKGKSVSLGDKVYAYYEDNTGNVSDLPNGSMIYPEYSAIYVHADIDDYVDHALYVNDRELSLTQTGDGYHFFGTIENPFSYDKLEVKLMEKAWTETELAKYVRVYADGGIDVYHYNSYYGEAQINYTVPDGGYFNKDEAIIIRTDAEKHPEANTLYINGYPVKCSLNSDNQWQIWAYEIPDDAEKLHISFKGKSVSLGDKIYAYYEDNIGNVGDLPSGSIIYPEYSAIYVHADIDDYVDHALYVNGRELSLIQTGDGYHFYGTIENPFSYDKLEVALVEKTWTDTELANYLRVYADEGIDFYHYNSYYGEAKINYTVPNGGYFTNDEAIVIRADAAKYPNAGTIYINGQPIQCSLSDDNQWQIWAYEIPDDVQKLTISFKGKEISLSDKIYAYYQDNRGNITTLPNGSTILPEYSVVYVHVDIDDYVDHALCVNDRELSLTQTGDGYHFFCTIEDPFSYDKLEVKLVEKAWTDTDLTKYVRVYADEGIDVYHYNSYYGEAKINYSVPVGGYFTNDEAIVIRADAAKYPNACTIYINGKPIQCTLNDDNQWQIWAYEIPDESDVLKISFSSSEEICDVITGVTVTEKNIIVTYSNADKTASETKTLAFNEVDVTIVDYMNKTDIQLVMDYVNSFSNSKADTIILTEAQLRAIEYVLAYDYAK